MNNKIKICGTHSIDLNPLLNGVFDLKSPDGLSTLSDKDQWIIFWEDPLRMVFRILHEGAESSSEALLNQWIESASEILKGVRRYRNQISLINLAEAQEHTEKFSEFCKDLLGTDATITRTQEAPWDSILPIFQNASLSCIRNLQTVLEELEVSSATLDSTFESASGVNSQKASNIFRAIDALTKIEHKGAKKEQVLALEEQLQEAHGELKEIRMHLQHKEDELRNTEQKARHNHELFLRELHEAFRESEMYFEQWKKAETSGGGLILKVDSVTRGHVIDRGSERHIDYTFHGAGLLGRSWSHLRVRLVRHHGRSGMVIFDTDTHPLYAWTPTGEEGVAKFMLFVPSDLPARDYLVKATTSDLLLIKEAATTILAELIMNGLPEGGATDWISVAENFLAQIDEIPERLHYDCVKSKLEEASGLSIEMQILNGWFRNRYYPSLRMAWETDSGKITIFGGEEGRPIFSAWPLDKEGRNKEYCELFVPSSSANDRAFTSKLTDRDKAFIGVLLGEVPNFLVHASNHHPKAKSRISSLSGKAKGLRKKALKLNAI